MAQAFSAKPSLWTRLRHWIDGLHLRVMTLEDTPHSIALGLAIGIFFGFTPLLSLKTLLSIGVAWLVGGNKIAAAVSVQLHDLLILFMPAIYLWEYKFGYWAIHGHLPSRVEFHGLRGYMHWNKFFTAAPPLLIGSIIVGLPSAALVYVVCRGLVTRHRAAKRA